jgi:hypothetical protein
VPETEHRYEPRFEFFVRHHSVILKYCYIVCTHHRSVIACGQFDNITI